MPTLAEREALLATLAATLMAHINALTPGTATPAPTPSPAPAPSPTGTAPSASVSISMLAGEAPSWNFADSKSRFYWRKPGGDWSDKNNDWWTTGAAAVASAFATATAKTFAVGAPLNFSMTAANGGLALITKLLAHNTGIMFRVVGTYGYGIAASSRNTLSAGPVLTITTSTGTFVCPLLVDCYIASSANQALINATLNSPALMKFDLSAVTGTPQSATLALTTANMYTIPVTFGLFYLETPSVVFDPATQVGGVVQGIAATVANDRDLASHPDVIAYNTFESTDSVLADAKANWTLANLNENGYGSWTKDPSYRKSPKYGVPLARVTIPVNPTGGGINGCSLQRWCSPQVTNGTQPKLNMPWNRPLGQGFEELYFRYLLRLDPDVEAGIDYAQGGVKLPGLMGSYEYWPYDNAVHWTDGLNPEHFGVAFNPSSDGYWAYRPEHIPASKTNPHLFPLSFYLYDRVAPIGTGSGAAPMVSQNFSFAPDHEYCVEMGVKLNTHDDVANVWNADGVIRLWIDGVLMFNVTDREIRADKRIQFQDIPHFRFFHGGRTSPVAPIHYETGAVCVARKYIGPPKRVEP